MKLNRKKMENAWCMYDWANSSYNLVITATIFPAYYNSVTQAVNGSDQVSFFGLEITNTVLYSYALSFSFLVIAAFSPLLSGIADYGGKKKTFMKFFTYIGSLACMGLFLFTGQNVELGILCALFASIGYSGSLVFYNAYLPEIVSKDRFDIVSAKGFSLGYIGSVLLLLFNLLMIMKPDWFGIESSSMAPRLSFLMVGLWWMGFAQIPFRRLPDNVYHQKPDYTKVVRKGYEELRKVFLSLKHLPMIRTFLLAFFFYSMGLQTVMLMAASFGSKEIGLAGEALIIVILIIQIVGVAGSYLFAFISKKIGNKSTLVTMVLIWIGICGAAYLTTTAAQFYALAVAVGLVMGGIQSLSRSTYSKLIPESTIDHASYFSFYDVTEKLAIVIGLFSFGLIEQLTSSMRDSSLVLGLFFVVGLVFLSMLRSTRATWSVNISEEDRLAA